MVAASRPDPDESTGEEDPPLPPDLRELRRLYRGLPPPGVRYKVVPGTQFLGVLAKALERHSVKRVAHALGLTPQGVDYMSKEVPRLSHPRPWPSQEDLRQFRAAWRTVVSDIDAGRSVGRKDPRYALVHHALLDLQEKDGQEGGFMFKDLCSALGISSRLLHRFDLPPMSAPGDIARGIERVLPQRPGPSRETLDRNNRGWRD